MLAPMEDVSDPPFRAICKENGADIMYTEFISSEGLIRDAEKSTMKLDIYDEERPIGIQIFGGNIESMKLATAICEQANPDIIDINYGCPVKKVVSKGAGAGILTVASETGSAKTAMLNLVGDGNDTDATRVASVFFNDASATGAGATLAGIEAYRASNHATDPGADLLFSTNASGGSYTEKMRIESSGNVGIGTTSPGTLLQLEGANAYLTLKNSTAENSDGGAETKIIFKDHSDIALAQIQASHDGTADDTKGDLIFSTHTGSA